MSLRTTYTGALDSKLAEARAAGNDAILIDNLAALTTAMTAAANSGKKTFTFTYTVSYQPVDLRLLGNLWHAYRTGVTEALASEDIMMNECAVSLNTSDTLTTGVDLKFTL